MTEIESNAALEKVLDEIRNINHDVLKSFIFQNSAVIAKDKFTSAEETSTTIQAFECISNGASAIEGAESVTIQASDGRIDINHINDFYVATVTSKEANPETIDNLTHVLIPGIFKIIQNVTPPPSTSQFPETNRFPLPTKEQGIKSSSSAGLGATQFLGVQASALEYNEFTVEDVGGLGALSSSEDTVRLDAITFGRWTEIFGENKIHLVSLKAENTGKTIECKSELSKDSKHQRDAVFLPELVQRKLNVKKGSKILVKPIVGQSAKGKLKSEPFIESTTKEQANGLLQEAFDKNSATANSELTHALGANSLMTEYSEFTVDDSGKLGIISGPGTVKLHIIAIGHWAETYGSSEIHSVVLKDKNSGKTIECKCETSKDPKHDRNAVRIPEPLQRKLEIKKGSKVLVKPIIKDKSSNKKSIPEFSKQNETNYAKLQSTKPDVGKPSENPLRTNSPQILNTPNYQLMVEDVSGLSVLREHDVVRFDKALPIRWKEYFGNRKINKVTITNPILGKSAKSKFKIVGGADFEGKGIIEIPKSIQNQLSVKEGSLVIVKPILE